MPIRLRDSNAVVGRVRVTLGDATASLAGTHTQPPSVSGSISSRLGDAACLVSASFTPAANRTGTIATTLANFTSSEFGISQPPPPPSRTGTVASSLAGVSANFDGTFTPVAQQQLSWWPNWPIMNCACLQGNANFHILDPSRHAELADKDVIIFQDFYPTESRKQTRVNVFAQIRALNPINRVKFLKYTMLQETPKVLPTPTGNSAPEISCALIADPVKGNPNWIVHRVGQTGNAGRVECNFDPASLWNCNMAVLAAGNNSLGENYATAFWKDWHALLTTGVNLLPSLDGMFQDNFNARPPAMFQNNGATSITDQDYNADGTADTRTDFSAAVNAGGRMWSQGHLEGKARFEQRMGASMVLCPNAARFDGDYFDGQGQPPLPITNHPYYRQFDLTLDESVYLLLGLSRSATGYSFTGAGSFNSLFRSYNVHDRMLKLDANNTRTGKSAVMMHALCIDRPTTNDDLAYARFISALCLLVERAAMCVMQTTFTPLSLDETLLELGAPVAARTMGTLNENTVSFSVRTADRTVGTARFYWSIFAKGMVLVRADSPSVGVYPSADAAVPCTLPTPPAGKKWQRINAANYVNPVTLRAMRGQDTAINNGADVTSVSLKPYHAIFLRLVNV